MSSCIYDKRNTLLLYTLILQEGTNLPYTEKHLRTEANGNMQPYIMCIRGQQRTTFFVQGDGWFFDLPHRATSIAAFDLLFKLY